MFSLPKTISLCDLEKMVNIFNETIVGHYLIEVFKSWKQKTCFNHNIANQSRGFLLRLIRFILQGGRDQVHVGGE